jgi:hypothetical protein
LKMLVRIVQKRQFYGIPFTFINILYNYDQLLDVLSVVSCAEILWCEYYECISKTFSLIGNLKILKLLIKAVPLQAWTGLEGG